MRDPRIDGGADHSHCAHHARRIWWGWWLFAAIALYLLLTAPRAGIFTVLPYVLLLACPLLHTFMHRGHRHRQSGDGAASNAGPPQEQDK